jgi:chromate transporter
MMYRDLVEEHRWISGSHFIHALNFCMMLPGPEAQQLATYLGWRLHGWRGASLSFIAIYYFNVSFIFIVCAAALLGGLGHSFFEKQFPASSGHGGDGEGKGEEGYVRLPDAPRGTWRRAVVVVVTCVVLWSLPVLGLGLWLDWSSVPVSQGLFFSKAAVVTFGGAYAVLPYVAQQAVENYGWLSHAQVMSGLALAETTPGPLVIVLQFVGFAGGWQHPGGFSPLVAAVLGAAITTWVTFVPCFLFVFLGGALCGEAA